MPRTNFQELLDAGVHFGHLARKWNPKMAPYIFDQKNGIHIIDLHKSIVKIDEAANVMKQLARSGRKILFVPPPHGSRTQQHGRKDTSMQVQHPFPHPAPRRAGDGASPGRPPPPFSVGHSPPAGGPDMLLRGMDGSAPSTCRSHPLRHDFFMPSSCCRYPPLL